MVIEIEVEIPVAQAFEGVMVIFPDVTPNVTSMDVVFCPEVITASGGTTQKYDVAPDTGLIEKVEVAPLQIDSGPEMVPTCPGGEQYLAT